MEIFGSRVLSSFWGLYRIFIGISFLTAFQNHCRSVFGVLSCCKAVSCLVHRFESGVHSSPCNQRVLVLGCRCRHNNALLARAIQEREVKMIYTYIFYRIKLRSHFSQNRSFRINDRWLWHHLHSRNQSFFFFGHSQFAQNALTHGSLRSIKIFFSIWCGNRAFLSVIPFAQVRERGFLYFAETAKGYAFKFPLARPRYFPLFNSQTAASCNAGKLRTFNREQAAYCILRSSVL